MIHQFLASGDDDDDFIDEIKRKGYLKEFEDVNGEPFFYIDGVSMILNETEQFYRDRLNGNKIWNTSKPFGFHFIDDNNEKICSISSNIERIMNNEILSHNFRENHFRIIKINPSIYKRYASFMKGSITLSENKSKWFNCQSCIRRMSIMKEMGNSIYKCGGLNKAALHLYIAATSQCKCIKQKHYHDVIKSKLYNNISLIFYKYKKYKTSRNYCIQALKLIPKYKKCQQRLQEINEIITCITEMD